MVSRINSQRRSDSHRKPSIAPLQFPCSLTILLPHCPDHHSAFTPQHTITTHHSRLARFPHTSLHHTNSFSSPSSLASATTYHPHHASWVIQHRRDLHRFSHIILVSTPLVTGLSLWAPQCLYCSMVRASSYGGTFENLFAYCCTDSILQNDTPTSD